MIEEKTPLLYKVVCLQIGTKGFYYFSEKLPLSQKLRYFRGKLFLTMFYTFNSSQWLVTKSVFVLIYILSNYQMCTVPLSVIVLVLTF